MLRAIGFYVAACRDIVLQAWLGKDADTGCDVVLEAETCANGPLPWNTKRRLVGSFQSTMQVLACVKW